MTQTTATPTLTDWTDWTLRNGLLLALPDRVWKLLNCEIAQTAQHTWVAKYPNNSWPQEGINARVAWCLNPNDIEVESEARAALDAWLESEASEASEASTAWAASAARAAGWSKSFSLYLAARPVSWRPEWSTSTVINFARGIYLEAAYDRFPIYADALEDAGCDNFELLNRLRDLDAVLARSDVSVWTPLGIGD